MNSRHLGSDMSQSPVSAACRMRSISLLSSLVVIATPLSSQQQPDAPKVRQSTGMVLRQVWAQSDLVYAMGSVSPDGCLLAYVDWRTGDLALRDLATGASRNLTQKGTWEESPEGAWYPEFSPDGRHVAYGWTNRDLIRELRVIDVDGSNKRVLYRDDNFHLYAEGWFPDGTAVLARAWRRGGGKHQIVQVSTLDSSLRVLRILEPGTDWPVSLSPDGRYVAYGARPKAEAAFDIFLLEVDGGRVVPLVQHPAIDADPVWTPDGNRILFTSDRRGSQDLWMIEVAGGEPAGTPALVKRHIDQLWPLGFTRDGSYFYGVWNKWTDVFVAELDLTTGEVVAPPSEISGRATGPSDLPAWSADGRYLAYLSDRSAVPLGGRSTVLTIRDFKTGDERDIPLDLSVELNLGTLLLWSPDGDSLFIKKGFAEVHHIDARTGDLTPSELLPRAASAAAWSRDGSRLFYSVLDAGYQTGSIMVRELETGTERELYHGPAPGGLALSPDERSLAFDMLEYSPRRATLKVMPAEGGAPRELITFDNLTLRGWASDGSGLIYARQTAQTGGVTLWYIPARGGEPRQLAPTMAGPPWTFQLHPDGRHVAFTAGDDSQEVWVLENFLPPPNKARPINRPGALRSQR